MLIWIQVSLIVLYVFSPCYVGTKRLQHMYSVCRFMPVTTIVICYIKVSITTSHQITVNLLVLRPRLNIPAKKLPKKEPSNWLRLKKRTTFATITITKKRSWCINEFTVKLDVCSNRCVTIPQWGQEEENTSSKIDRNTMQNQWLRGKFSDQCIFDSLQLLLNQIICGFDSESIDIHKYFQIKFYFKPHKWKFLRVCI